MAATTDGRGGAVSATTLGIAGVVALVVLTVYTTLSDPAPKLVGIGWFAFAAMAGMAALGRAAGDVSALGLVWGYGLASGAMVTSSAVFLVPDAINHDAKIGGFGIAAGLLVGFAAHTIGHRLAHLDLPIDRTAAELTAHALAAGSIIGVVYTAMPSLGPLLGLAIISHKGPAGYAAAHRLLREGRSVNAILLPASGVGVAALLVSLVEPPSAPAVQAAVFGFAAGIFLHVALDFLPHCETGSDVHDAATGHDHDSDESAHARLDRLRLNAVASTLLGGGVVLAAWLAVA